MKIIKLLLCVVVAMAYDDIDNNYHDTLLKNNKLLSNIFGCIVDVNPCDDIGVHIKSHVVEALSDSCRECSDIHKHYMHAYIVKLKNDFPQLYEKFEKKYDPSRKLLKKLDENMVKFS